MSTIIDVAYRPNKKHKVVTLEGSVNYIDWRDQIELVLRADRSWDITVSTTTKPQIIDHLEPITIEEYQAQVPHVVEQHPNRTDAAWRKSMEEYKQIIKRSERWKDRNENAILNMFDTMSDTVRKEVGPRRDANIVWVRLNDLYGTTKVPEINRLISSIFETSIEKYNYDYTAFSRAILAIDSNLDTNFNTLKVRDILAYMLVCNLPTEWDAGTSKYKNGDEYPEPRLIAREVNTYLETRGSARDKSKPTAGTNSNPKVLNTAASTSGIASNMASGNVNRKRRGTTISLPAKRRIGGGNGGKPLCHECNGHHKMSKKGICFTAHPDQTPEWWNALKNADGIIK
jgi:hypothetical protein